MDPFESMLVKIFDLSLGLLSAFLKKKKVRWTLTVENSSILNVLRTSLTCFLREKCTDTDTDTDTYSPQFT